MQFGKKLRNSQIIILMFSSLEIINESRFESFYVSVALLYIVN